MTEDQAIPTPFEAVLQDMVVFIQKHPQEAKDALRDALEQIKQTEEGARELCNSCIDALDKIDKNEPVGQGSLVILSWTMSAPERERTLLEFESNDGQK